MLSSLVKEHQARQAVRKEQQEARRREALAAATSLTQVTEMTEIFIMMTCVHLLASVAVFI